MRKKKVGRLACFVHCDAYNDLDINFIFLLLVEYLVREIKEFYL